YPSLGLFSGAIQDPPLAAAVCRAYNRWLADYCKPYPDRLFGVAMLPMQSIDLAIEEMRFAKKQLGMRGGFLRPNPYNGRLLHRSRSWYLTTQSAPRARASASGAPAGSPSSPWRAAPRPSRTPSRHPRPRNPPTISIRTASPPAPRS